MTAAVELQITDVAFGGKGVARANGKAVFVPYVVDGETVSANITREHKKFLETELENIVTASPHRVEPRCPYFGRCGGCVYQHIDYEHQLALKWRQVKETLRRIGRLQEPPMRPFIPSPIEYEYRNRITVHVRDGVIGFFRRESNKLLDIEGCPIALSEVNAQLLELRGSRERKRTVCGGGCGTGARRAIEINRARLGRRKQCGHSGPACNRPEQNHSRNADGTSTSPIDLRFLQSRDSRARPCHFKTIVPDRFDHPTRHVSTNCRNRGSD